MKHTVIHINISFSLPRFVCPKCTKESIVFPSTTGGVRRLAKEMNVHFLGQIPLDHRLAQSCDQGKDFFECFPGSTTALALFQLVEGIIILFYLDTCKQIFS